MKKNVYEELKQVKPKTYNQLTICRIQSLVAARNATKAFVGVWLCTVSTERHAY